MTEPTKEELLEFMRKNYGEEWANESMLSLAKMLWQKKFGNKYVSESPEYQKVKINELERGANYIVEGIVLNIEKAQYQGCPICKRSTKRACQHILSGEVKPVWLTRMIITVSDGSGELIVDGVFEKDVPDIQLGDLIRVKGYVSKNPNVLKMIYNDAEVLKRISASDNFSGQTQKRQVPIQKSNNVKKPEPEKKNDVFDDFGWQNDGNGKDKDEPVEQNNGSGVVIPYKIFKMLEFVNRVGSMARTPLERMASHEGIQFAQLLEYLEPVGEDKFKVRSDIDLDKVDVR